MSILYIRRYSVLKIIKHARMGIMSNIVLAHFPAFDLLLPPSLSKDMGSKGSFLLFELVFAIVVCVVILNEEMAPILLSSKGWGELREVTNIKYHTWLYHQKQRGHWARERIKYYCIERTTIIMVCVGRGLQSSCMMMCLIEKKIGSTISQKPSKMNGNYSIDAFPARTQTMLWENKYPPHTLGTRQTPRLSIIIHHPSIPSLTFSLSCCFLPRQLLKWPPSIEYEKAIQSFQYSNSYKCHVGSRSSR